MPEALVPPPSTPLECDASLEGSAHIEVGERTRLHVSVRNAGAQSVPTETMLMLSAPPSLVLVTTSPHRRAVGRRSGAPAAGRELAFAIPPLLAGESFELEIDAYALEADPRASVAVRGGVSAEVELCITASPAFAPAANSFAFDASEARTGEYVEGRVVVTNTGSAPAERFSVRLDGELDELFLADCGDETLAPQERRILRVAGRIPQGCADATVLRAVAAAVCAGGVHRIGEVRIVARGRPRFEGSFTASAETAAAGEAVAWRLRVHNAGDAAAPEVRVAGACTGAVYLPGSTTIDGCPLLDAAGTSPLWSSEGLAFEGVGPHASFEIAWTALVDVGAERAAAFARIVCGESEVLVESGAVRVDVPRGEAPQFGFAVRGAAFRAVSVVRAEPAPVMPPLKELPLRPDVRTAALDANVVRHLGVLPGLVRHLWALGVLCADRSDDPERSARLEPVRVALRSVFDRLSIKVRMPQYRVEPEDVLDPAAIEALDALEPGIVRARGRVLVPCLERALGAIGPAAGDPLAAAALDSYREVFAAEIRGRSDAEIVALLDKTQPALDEGLDAVLACEADLVIG